MDAEHVEEEGGVDGVGPSVVGHASAFQDATVFGGYGPNAAASSQVETGYRCDPLAAADEPVVVVALPLIVSSVSWLFVSSASSVSSVETVSGSTLVVVCVASEPLAAVAASVASFASPFAAAVVSQPVRLEEVHVA